MNRRFPPAATILAGMVLGIALGYMVFLQFPDKKSAAEIAVCPSRAFRTSWPVPSIANVSIWTKSSLSSTTSTFSRLPRSDADG